MNHKATKIGNALGLVSVVVFVVCMFWGNLLATTELQQLHLGLIQVFYPGFGFNATGVIIGLVESFIYGWLIGAGFIWICKKVCK